MTIERKLARHVDSLEDIFSMVESFFRENGVDEALRYSVDLSVEELFTNMVRHNIGGGDEIIITMERVGNELVISLTDFDTEPFDPRQVPEVDIGKPAEERTPGGLGIHLVRKMMDSIDYEYCDGKSKITVRKALDKD